MGRDARPVLAEGPPTTSVLTSVRKQGATFSLVFWPQRKIRDAELVDCDPVERTRAPWTLSTRSVLMRYHLMAGGSGDRKQVCKKCAPPRWGAGEWSVLSWAQKHTAAGEFRGKHKEAKHRGSLVKPLSTHSSRSSWRACPKCPLTVAVRPSPSCTRRPSPRTCPRCTGTITTTARRERRPPLSWQVLDLGLCDPRRDQGCTFGATGKLVWRIMGGVLHGKGSCRATTRAVHFQPLSITHILSTDKRDQIHIV